MQYLIQILLPLYDNSKKRFDRKLYDEIRDQLKDKFGGVTLYRHSPAEGMWEDETGETNYDELITAEIMVEDLNRQWWQQYRDQLKRIFKQDEILIRAISFDKL